MNIVLASDPFAYSLKKVLIDHLQGNGHTVIDADHDSGITYYEAAEKGVAVIQNGEAEYGIMNTAWGDRTP